MKADEEVLLMKFIRLESIVNNIFLESLIEQRETLRRMEFGVETELVGIKNIIESQKQAYKDIINRLEFSHRELELKLLYK